MSVFAKIAGRNERAIETAGLHTCNRCAAENREFRRGINPREKGRTGDRSSPRGSFLLSAGCLAKSLAIPIRVREFGPPASYPPSRPAPHGCAHISHKSIYPRGILCAKITAKELLISSARRAMCCEATRRAVGSLGRGMDDGIGKLNVCFIRSAPSGG